jgi:hypothetical protein
MKGIIKNFTVIAVLLMIFACNMVQGTAGESSATRSITTSNTGQTMVNGLYIIRNVNSGKVIDVSGISTENGANISQWTYYGTENQQWIITHLGDGKHSILARHTHKAMDVDGVSADPGANIHQWDYVGGANQQWYILNNGDGSFTLQSVHSGLVLDVADWGTQDGANILQWNSHGGSNQKWTLESLSTEIQLEAENAPFQSGVETENCVEGGQNIGWIDANDWIAYTDIDIPFTGS